MTNGGQRHGLEAPGKVSTDGCDRRVHAGGRAACSRSWDVNLSSSTRDQCGLGQVTRTLWVSVSPSVDWGC